MILSTLAQSQRIEALHPRFKALFDYIKTHDLTKVPAGRITLDGTDLFINVADATLVDAADQKLEVHREYIDIHFTFSGEETVGWTALEALQTESEAAFDTENDFTLYAEPRRYLLHGTSGRLLHHVSRRRTRSYHRQWHLAQGDCEGENLNG